MVFHVIIFVNMDTFIILLSLPEVAPEPDIDIALWLAPG